MTDEPRNDATVLLIIAPAFLMFTAVVLWSISINVSGLAHDYRAVHAAQLTSGK